MKYLLFVALIVLSVMAVTKQPLELWLTPDQQGDRLLAEQRDAEAAQAYEDPVRQGIAHYRAGAFEEAALAFARVDEPDSAFNRGNALVLLGKYDEAIGSFDRALQLQANWRAAEENRAIAIARRDQLIPPDDDAGGTGGQLEADEIVFDDRAKNSSDTQEIEAGAGERMSDESLRELWLQRVKTDPGDFLRAKFAYQLARRAAESKP